MAARRLYVKDAHRKCGQFTPFTTPDRLVSPIVLRIIVRILSGTVWAIAVVRPQRAVQVNPSRQCPALSTREFNIIMLLPSQSGEEAALECAKGQRFRLEMPRTVAPIEVVHPTTCDERPIRRRHAVRITRSTQIELGLDFVS